MASARLHFILSDRLTGGMIELAGLLAAEAPAAANRIVNLTVYSPQLYQPSMNQTLENLQSSNPSSVKVVYVQMKRRDIFDNERRFQRIIEGRMEEELQQQPSAGYDWILSDLAFPWIEETANKFEMPFFSVRSAARRSSYTEPKYHLRLYPPSSPEEIPPRFSLQEICVIVVREMENSSSSLSRHTTGGGDPDPDSIHPLQEEELLIIPPDKEVRFFVVIVTGSDSVAAEIGQHLSRQGEDVQVFCATRDVTPSRALPIGIQSALERGPTGIIADRNNYWIVETALISQIPLFSVSKSSSPDLNYVLVHHKPQKPSCRAISSGELAGAKGSDSQTVPSNVSFEWELTLPRICTFIVHGGNEQHQPAGGFQDSLQIEEDEEPDGMASPHSSVGEDHLLEEQVVVVDHIEAENQEEPPPAAEDIAAENQEDPLLPLDAGTLAAINGLRVFMEERHLELLGDVHAVAPEVSLAVGLLQREKTANRKLYKLIIFILLLLIPLTLAIFSSIVWIIIWKISGHEDKVYRCVL